MDIQFFHFIFMVQLLKRRHSLAIKGSDTQITPRAQATQNQQPGTCSYNNKLRDEKPNRVRRCNQFTAGKSDKTYSNLILPCPGQSPPQQSVATCGQAGHTHLPTANSPINGRVCKNRSTCSMKMGMGPPLL